MLILVDLRVTFLSFFTKVLFMMGFRWALGFTRYNDWWKSSRWLFHQDLQPLAAPRFRPNVIKASHSVSV
jgi:hypothetical protein